MSEPAEQFHFNSGKIIIKLYYYIILLLYILLLLLYACVASHLQYSITALIHYTLRP